jgi:hypothetical protein
VRRALAAKPQVCNDRAHGVVVSHPLSMREALGSIPSVSKFCLGISRVFFQISRLSTYRVIFK